MAEMRDRVSGATAPRLWHRPRDRRRRSNELRVSHLWEATPSGVYGGGTQRIRRTLRQCLVSPFAYSKVVTFLLVALTATQTKGMVVPRMTVQPSKGILLGFFAGSGGQRGSRLGP